MQKIPELPVAALRLRNADPEGWDQFLSSFMHYANNRYKQLVNCSGDSLLNVQGQAQQCEALLRIFVECERAKE